MRAIPLATRFWAKVHKTKTCWLYTGQRQNQGYGQIWVNEHGKSELAHRVSWFLATGRWPNKFVLHKCDVKLCVRHKHHFLGTKQDNTDDCVRKGRASGGRFNSTKTHCPHGHPYSGENLSVYHYKGYTFRRCKQCMYLHCKARYKAT